MDRVVERPGALDVHTAQVTAAVRLPPPPGKKRRVEAVAEFSTTVTGLLALADWLGRHGVERVAMEATGDYWKPVWNYGVVVFVIIAIAVRPGGLRGPRAAAMSEEAATSDAAAADEPAPRAT